jgi:hypothetical protein
MRIDNSLGVATHLAGAHRMIVAASVLADVGHDFGVGARLWPRQSLLLDVFRNLLLSEDLAHGSD